MATFKKNLYRHGGVVAYSSNITIGDYDTEEKIATAISNGDIVYNKHWVGTAPKFKSNEYIVEKAFVNGEDYIVDYVSATFEIMFWDISKNNFSSLKGMRKLLSDLIANGTDVSLNYLYICPRFDFLDKDTPTVDTMINNRFYRCKLDTDYYVDDIGSSGAGMQNKLSFTVLDYLNDYDINYEDSLTNIYSITGLDISGTIIYEITGDDTDGTFTITGLDTLE